MNSDQNSTRTENENVQMAVMANDIGYVRRSIDAANESITSLDKKISENYVTVERFQLVEKLVYGLVGLILIGVVGAIMTLVLRTPQ